MSEAPQSYLAYLLRLWAAREEGRVVWRASLDSPQTGERLGFASLDRLFAFVREQCGVAGEASPPAAEGSAPALQRAASEKEG